MSALCHFKKPPSERCRIFICRTSPGGFREVTDWPEAELAWTQTVDSTFTPGVLWIYLMPRKCDPPTTWTVLSLGWKSKPNPHVILNRKRNKKSLLSLAQGQSTSHTQVSSPTLREKEGFSLAQVFSFCQGNDTLSSHFSFWSCTNLIWCFTGLLCLK